MKPAPLVPATSRADHLAWCKRRALEFVDAGELYNAVASMVSDLSKHRDTAALALTSTLADGILIALPEGPDAVRKWIEGFT